MIALEPQGFCGSRAVLYQVANLMTVHFGVSSILPIGQIGSLINADEKGCIYCIYPWRADDSTRQHAGPSLARTLRLAR